MRFTRNLSRSLASRGGGGMRQSGDIGKQLRELRHGHGKRLADISQQTALSISYLSDIERNRRCVFDTTLATLNKILACYKLKARIVFEPIKEET